MVELGANLNSRAASRLPFSLYLWQCGMPTFKNNYISHLPCRQEWPIRRKTKLVVELLRIPSPLPCCPFTVHSF